MQYILALDQGTTSSRAIIFDRTGAVRSSAQREFRQIYPQPGWVEHDPVEIWTTQSQVMAQALQHAGLTSRDIAAIGIANQRETTIVWERSTGRPIHNAIVWQDRRTAEQCNTLNQMGLGPQIQHTTGLLLDAYFSATKVAWLLDNLPGARTRAERGELAFGTVDSWLVWNLTGGRLHVTDVTNASRTLLFDIHTGQWDETMLKTFNIPLSMLPEVRSSSEIYGETSCPEIDGSIPIAGIAGDQQAALLGQGCHRRGMAKNTYGTGCFMLMHTGDTPVVSQHRLLTTPAVQVGRESGYALEGSVFVAGAAVQWLRDGLGIIESSSEVEALAASVPDNGGVYLVPAFTGLGAPHWDADARGAIFGITRGTTAAHIARATLESIAFQSADLLRAMQNDAGARLDELRVDGGAAANNLLMQFQADLLDVAVVRPKTLEITALGAAYLAGLAVGYWLDLNQLENQWQAEKVFEPTLSRDQAMQLQHGWQQAVERTKNWSAK